MSDLMISNFQRELDTLPPAQISRKTCIYRVPMLLRQQKEDAFTPLQVSIGPFHHKKEGLILSMEANKLKYLQSLIKDSESDLKSYIGIIKDKEREIRECYAEPIDMSSDDFVRMVLIDSAFIIEHFRRDLILLPFTSWEVRHDLHLAENQLPFFILKDLYWAAFSHGADTFTDLVCGFFGVEKGRLEVDPSSNEAVCCHFVDLLRSSLLQQQQLDAAKEHHRVDVDVGAGMDDTNLLCPAIKTLL